MQYNLVFSTDSNYLPYLFVMSQSIIDNIEQRESNAQDELVFNVIIDNSINLSYANSKAQAFIEHNQTSKIKHSFAWHPIDGNTFKNFKCMHREHDNQAVFSTYYRFIIDTLLPDEVSVAAYLDVDMMVNTDIRRLFDENNLKDMVLGAVVDPGAFNYEIDQISTPVMRLKSKSTPSEMLEIPRKTYFNAGVLLINLDEWRKQNIRDKCFDIISKFDVIYHDQDALNAACMGKVKIIDLSWNFQTIMFFTLYNHKSEKYDILSAFDPEIKWKCETPSAVEFEQSLASPNIVHFTSVKPWWPDPYVFLPCMEQQTTPPKLEKYLQEWRKLFYSITPEANLHLDNTEAISRTSINLYHTKQSVEKIFRKMKKIRKIYNAGLLFLLILNLFTLVLVLIK